MSEPNFDEINAVIAAVSSQRNQLANENALLQAKIAVAQAKIADLENQLKKTGEEPHGEGPPTS